MQHLTGVEDRRARTVTFDKQDFVFWIAALIIYATTAWAFLTLFANHLSRRVQVEVPIKGILVINRQGDIIEHDSKTKVSFGQNLILLMPYAEKDEARQKIRNEDCVTLKTSIGTVQLVATSEGRMVGVIK